MTLCRSEERQRVEILGLGGANSDAASFANTAALTLAAPAPHPMVNVVFQGVFQAWCRDRTRGADFPGPVNADPIAGEKRVRGVGATRAIGHPRGN